MLDSVGSLLRAWRVRQGLTQAEVAALLHATTKTVSNWETGSRRVPMAALTQLDSAYDACGCLVDLARALGKMEAVSSRRDVGFLEPRRSWSHTFDDPTSPVWVWVRSVDGEVHEEPLGGTVSSGPLGVRLEGVGPGGIFVTLASWQPSWPFHVVLDRPGWVEYGRGVPPLLPGLARSASFLGQAEFVHAPDQQVEFFARKLRERDQGDPTTLADRLRVLAGPANWDAAAASWLRGAEPPGRPHAGVAPHEVLPPSTPDERRESHRQLRTALGLSRAEVAVAVTNLLGTGARPVSEHQIYHYEDGRISRIRHLPALLDRVYGADGWTCLESVPLRRVGPGRVLADFPLFWVGPVRVAAEPIGPLAAAGPMALAMGSWENQHGLRLGSSGEPDARPQAFRFCRTPGAPPVEFSVPSGWTIQVHMGHDPDAVVANTDWSPAEAHGDGIFDAAIESLVRAVGRTRADLDEALGHASDGLVGA